MANVLILFLKWFNEKCISNKVFSGVLAAPGYVEHRLSMYLSLVGQCQLGHTFWHQSSHIQTMSSIDLPFFTGRYPLYMAILSDCQEQRIDVISSMPSVCSSEAWSSSLPLMPQIEWIMAWSLQWTHCSSKLFGFQVSPPWSIAEQMQASYTFPLILGERCLVFRTAMDFLNFHQAIQHLAAMALSQPPPEHSISPIQQKMASTSSKVLSTFTSAIVQPSVIRDPPLHLGQT